MSQCGVIAPRREDMIGDREDGYMGECILEGHHFSQHLIHTPEDVYIRWEDDKNCGCCEPDEDNRCTIFETVSKRTAQRMIKKALGQRRS